MPGETYEADNDVAGDEAAPTPTLTMVLTGRRGQRRARRSHARGTGALTTGEAVRRIHLQQKI